MDVHNIDFANSNQGSSSIGQTSSYANLNLTRDDHVRRLLNFSKAGMGISIFFWCWALKNSMKMNGSYDFGLFSFFMSGSSSLYLYRHCKDGLKGFQPIGHCGRLIVVATHVIVTLNYALGAFLACFLGKTVYYGFLYYCLCFTLLWLGSAVLVWDLTANTLHIINEDDEEYGF
jgi:hypothetical protein